MMTLSKLFAVKKFVALKLKKTTMKMIPMTIGRTPRLPDLRFSTARVQRLATPAGVASAGGGGLVLPDDVGCAHGVAPAVDAMPETLVGVPAVIA